MKTILKNKDFIIIPFFVVAVIGFAFYHLSFPMFFTSDCYHYLFGAENIAKGNGYLSYNEAFNGNNEMFLPVVNWPPVYSAVIAIFIKIFGLSAIDASKLVNLISWLCIACIWMYIYYSQIRNTKLRIIGAIILVLPGYMITYLNTGLSDVFSFAILSSLILLVYKSIYSNNKKHIYAYLLISSVLVIISVLTRYASMALAVGYFFIFIIHPKLNKKEKLFLGLISVVILLTCFGSWYYRNLSLAGKGVIDVNNGMQDSIWDIKRGVFVFNVFMTGTFGLPEMAEKVYFMPFAIIIAVLFYWFFNSKIKLGEFISKHSFTFFLLGMTGIYFAEIFYMCQVNRSVGRYGGYIRYFSFCMPILLFVIFYLFEWFNSNRKKTIVYLLSFIIILISIGNITTAIKFTKTPYTVNQSQFRQLTDILKKNANTSSTLISNMPKEVFFYTRIPCLAYKKQTNSEKKEGEYLYMFSKYAARPANIDMNGKILLFENTDYIMYKERN